MDAKNVVVHGIRRSLVVCKVHAYESSAFTLLLHEGFLQTRNNDLMTLTVQTKSVNDRSVLRQTEHTRRRISRLRFGSNAPHFQKTQTTLENLVNGLGLLVEASSKSHTVGKVQTPHGGT